MIKRLTITVLVTLLLFLCASAEELLGSWAYIHAPEEAAFILKADGTAFLDGEAYAYEFGDGFIVMTAKDGSVHDMRYAADGEEMLLYKAAEYTWQGSGEPAGLVGLWKDASTKWSYEFTDKGTFLEDGYFPGYYSMNEDGKSFKLVYLDQFADTVCYYEIAGDKLIVEYPWTMVRTK